MSGRALNWYLQRITGAALLVLLIMHFWVEHFTAEVRTPEGLTFEVIQRRFFRVLPCQASARANARGLNTRRCGSGAPWRDAWIYAYCAPSSALCPD